MKVLNIKSLIMCICITCCVACVEYSDCLHGEDQDYYFISIKGHVTDAETQSALADKDVICQIKYQGEYKVAYIENTGEDGSFDMQGVCYPKDSIFYVKISVEDMYKKYSGIDNEYVIYGSEFTLNPNSEHDYTVEKQIDLVLNKTE